MRSSGRSAGTAITAISPQPVDLTFVAATALEARALRRALPDATVIEVGIGLARIGQPARFGGAVISCGLCGGLRFGLPAGAVIIPDSVSTVAGSFVACDSTLVAALVAGARRVGIEPERTLLVSADRVVTHDERRALALRGYAAVDMETAFIDAPRVAAVRVVLDSPEHEISHVWARPARAIVRPHLWGELLWLTRNAPRCARLAATIAASAFPALG